MACMVSVRAFLLLYLLAETLRAQGLLAEGLFLRNLVRNGDAESGQASDGNTAPGIYSWATSEPGVAIIPYGDDHEFPEVSTSESIGGGSNFFSGGRLPSTSISQIIDVFPVASNIDKNLVKAKLSAHLGGFASNEDNAVVIAQYLDRSMSPIGSFSIGPVTASDRNRRTTLLLREAVKPVPAGTKFIRVILKTVRENGNYNDGYADNIQLILTM